MSALCLMGTTSAASAWRSRLAEEAITCLRQIIFTDDVIAIKDESRLVPAKPIATFSGIPAATMFRTALRRKSWIKSPW